MITKELTIEEQRSILSTLFGFSIIDESLEGEEPHYVVYDDDGNEFYGDNQNSKWDFSTLLGIFSYTANRAKKQGYEDCQYAFRKLLNL